MRIYLSVAGCSPSKIACTAAEHNCIASSIERANQPRRPAIHEFLVDGKSSDLRKFVAWATHQEMTEEFDRYVAKELPCLDLVQAKKTWNEFKVEDQIATFTFDQSRFEGAYAHCTRVLVFLSTQMSPVMMVHHQGISFGGKYSLAFSADDADKQDRIDDEFHAAEPVTYFGEVIEYVKEMIDAYPDTFNTFILDELNWHDERDTSTDTIVSGERNWVRHPDDVSLCTKCEKPTIIYYNAGRIASKTDEYRPFCEECARKLYKGA